MISLVLLVVFAPRDLAVQRMGEQATAAGIERHAGLVAGSLYAEDAAILAGKGHGDG